MKDQRVTTRVSREQLRDLEKRIMALDVELRTQPTDQAEAERVHLERQHALLWDALAALDRTATRPSCPCGKRAHPTREEADAHRAALVTLRMEQRGRPRLTILRRVRTGPLQTYYCPYLPGGSYHVGHQLKGGRR